MAKQCEATNVGKAKVVTMQSLHKDSTKSNPKPLGVMVIGAGFVARGYLDYFNRSPKTRLAAIVDSDPAILNKLSKEFSTELLTEDYKEAIKRNGIDVVVVCTSHYLHHEMVVEALRAGKDVICEKPIAISLKEADSMIDTAQKQGRKLLVSLNMRFVPWAVKIREFIAQNKLGRIFMARSAYLGYEVKRLDDPEHWKGDMQRAGGGVLLDGGYHIIDLMNSCLGRAKYVQANGGRFVVKAPNKGEDNCSLMIEYESGTIANLITSFTVCGPDCNKEPTLFLQHEFYGIDGTLLCRSGWDPVRGAQNELELLSADNGLQEIDLNEVHCPNLYDNFIDCLQHATEPIVTATDSRNASAVVEAAYQSMKTGGKVPVDWRHS